MPSAAGAQRPRGVRWVVAAASLVVLLDSTALRAQPAASSAPVASASAASAAQAAPAPIDDARDNALVVNHRTIVTLSATHGEQLKRLFAPCARSATLQILPKWVFAAAVQLVLASPAKASHFSIATL